MSKLFLNIFDFLVTRRWLALLIAVMIVASCLFAAFKLHYEEDISAFLPMDKQVAEYTKLYSEIGGQDRIAVIFRGETNEVIRAMDLFGELLESSRIPDMVNNWQVTVDEQQVLLLVEYLWRTFPLFLTEEDYAKMDSLLTLPNFVDNQLSNNTRMLMLPVGGLLSRSIPYDPFQLSSRIIGELKNNITNEHYQLIDGHIFSKDGQRGIVLLSSKFGISESKQNEVLVSTLKSLFDRVGEQFTQVDISCIGAPVIAVANANQIKRDSIYAVILSVILIISVLIYSIRSMKGIVLIGFSLLFGWIFAIGMLALFNNEVSIIVLGIGSVIIGIAANYPLHFINHTKHEKNIRDVLKEMAPPLLIGNITTVSAFLCLVFIDAKAMHDLGIFGSLMLVGTILFVLVFLPIVLSNASYEGKPYAFLRHGVWSIPPRIRTIFLLLVVILTICFAVFSKDTSFDSELQHINYMTQEQSDNLKFLSSSLQANDSLSTLFLVSKGNNLDQTLDFNEKILDTISSSPLIKHIKGPNGIILSKKKRESQEKKWIDFWGNHQHILDKLKTVSAHYGYSSDVFAPFEKMCKYGIEESDDEILFSMIGKHFLLESPDNVRIVNMVSVTNQHTEEVKKQVKAAMRSEDHVSAFIFDQKDLSNGLVNVLSDSFNYIGYVCGLVVFIFLWISFGRLELSLIAFLPLAVSWIWILGIMNLSNIQFNIVNIILATFIFGQGDDYSIFITEGLSYEYAYGRKRLMSYKDSVALSAILMFIGIGSLIFAKHPALYSLAQVAIIGMIVVVFMTFYLPPHVFRWLVYKTGKTREIPITLERLAFSLWSLLFFLFFTMLFFVPYALFHIFFLSKSKKCRAFFHRVLQEASRFVIYRVPGVKFRYLNEVNERFDRPAMIICNHQSHLDVMCLLMMSPKIVILTNDWVWNNPFYGAIIRAAEFYPISEGMDKNLSRLKILVQRGYSVVVFPEGTRTKHRGIMRFHQGAFAMAKALELDILPVMIHGLADVLPKRDFMLRRGRVTVEVHQRMPACELKDSDVHALRQKWHKWYMENYKVMSRREETIAYWIPYIKYAYMYKGYDVERRCQNELSKIVNDSSYLPSRYVQVESMLIVDRCGQGEVAILLALTNPLIEVRAYEADPDLFAICSNNTLRPKNLHFINATYQL